MGDAGSRPAMAAPAAGGERRRPLWLVPLSDINMILLSYHSAFAMADIALRGLPDDIHRALKDAARRNHRSLNGEILARLEASVRPPVRDVDALLKRIRTRSSRLELGCLQEDELRTLRDDGRA